MASFYVYAEYILPKVMTVLISSHVVTGELSYAWMTKNFSSCPTSKHNAEFSYQLTIINFHSPAMIWSWCTCIWHNNAAPYMKYMNMSISCLNIPVARTLLRDEYFSAFCVSPWLVNICIFIWQNVYLFCYFPKVEKTLLFFIINQLSSVYPEGYFLLPTKY